MLFVHRIGWKLIAAAGLVVTLIVAVFSFLILQANEHDLLRQVDQAAHQLSETVKSSTRYCMLRNDRDDLHGVICNIAHGSDSGG